MVGTEEASILGSPIKNQFYDNLPYDKIKINWNRNPIRMSLFLSFLKVDVDRSNDHLGSCTGWTLLYNDELKLRIGGGIVNGEEFLDTIQFGLKLSNPYNNYVNPFYLFEILSKEGKLFFVDYYSEDIEKILKKYNDNIASLEAQLEQKINLLTKIKSEINYLKTSPFKI